MSGRMGRRFRVRGRVQGVGYRAFAVRAAAEAGVSGWVRNCDDGTVEAHANGTPRQLDDFEARLRLGPRWSEVRGVDTEDAAVADASGFHIR